MTAIKECDCGCGKIIPYMGNRGKPNRYARGHPANTLTKERWKNEEERTKLILSSRRGRGLVFRDIF